jgi:hypothetical protein
VVEYPCHAAFVATDDSKTLHTSFGYCFSMITFTVWYIAFRLLLPLVVSVECWEIGRWEMGVRRCCYRTCGMPCFKTDAVSCEASTLHAAFQSHETRFLRPTDYVYCFSLFSHGTRNGVGEIKIGAVSKIYPVCFLYPETSTKPDKE